MQQSHNISYAEYGRKLTKRITVEQKRQREYEQSKHIGAELQTLMRR